MISKKNIKYIQSLHLKKRRDEENMFVVEGPKMVSELLRTNLNIQQIYAVDGNWLQTHKNSLTEEISPAELRQISSMETPNQVLALVEKKPALDTGGKITIILDGIQDPGNLGTIIRIADWFGIRQIIASIDTADEYNPKVVQATMGSIFRVNVSYQHLAAYLQNNRLPVFAAMLNGLPVRDVNIIKEGIILIGNESKGIREELFPFITKKITIPGSGQAESLNAGVALGIILSHLL